MSENKLKQKKDKVVGSTKEATGKALDNEELQLKGKLQKDKTNEVDSSTKDDIKNDKDDVKEETEEFTNKVDKNNDFIMEGRDPDDCY